MHMECRKIAALHPHTGSHQVCLGHRWSFCASTQEIEKTSRSGSETHATILSEGIYTEVLIFAIPKMAVGRALEDPHDLRPRK